MGVIIHSPLDWRWAYWHQQSRQLLEMGGSKCRKKLCPELWRSGRIEGLWEVPQVPSEARSLPGFLALGAILLAKSKHCCGLSTQHVAHQDLEAGRKGPVQSSPSFSPHPPPPPKTLRIPNLQQPLSGEG